VTSSSIPVAIPFLVQPGFERKEINRTERMVICGGLAELNAQIEGPEPHLTLDR
jgi:hypothetical protein